MTKAAAGADRPTKLARLEPLVSTRVALEFNSAHMDTARRLRLSCDACGAAKTKCDRIQPRCGRCSSMSLACVYGPSKQLGKRPRRKLDIGPRFSDRGETPQANGAYRGPAIEEFAAESSGSNSTFDPILDMSITHPQDISITPPQDIQLSLPQTSITWPPTDFPLWGDRHRCYHESNDVIHLLSVPERMFADDGPIVLDVSDILQATRRAIESLNRLVDCNCAKKRGHQVMMYASLISRALWWYREASGDTAYCVPEATSMPSPNTPSDNSTPPPSIPQGSDRCVRIKASAVTVGGFNIDDPQMQRTFRNQLIRHEVSKVGHLIDKYVALATDPNVQEEDRVLFSTLGTWLRADFSKALSAVADASNRPEDS
ncbi:hypothetical protein P171DRAFT_286133 [Karstenula rhodostoma CBS 690.94]|uniref:Zn(2)-C6 fungal-type domain-containing protein n=1 Tax=Karstenula rhodostoma CBS 690.94 TaxID=1392251 RepID=A0A9P4PIY8_9PLEO|nr:hypothetical protein P171DRAFT_286133 [Karstenula rhodostoma CBS 690.94]